MRIGTAPLFAALVAALLASTPSQAYYHYIRYNSRNAPYTPIYEKFDLYSGTATMVPNKTVAFFVSDPGPASYGPNDSFGAVLSQVKQALAQWNAVPSSDLRVIFGGVENSAQQISATPGGDVVFADLGPGVLGLGGTTPSSTQVNGFFPILHSQVILNRDASQAPGPSFLEAYFTTAVHEVGHALGLQHTWTGSAMSQATVRNTSRTRPLDADDLAGLSILYGKPGWASGYGSITGRVTYANGSPVALASVVAISTTGPAVSALTDPNGAYRIDGIPPNLSYQVYVHPLPPDAIAGGEGLQAPADLSGRPFNPTGAFQTVFFPGTLDPQQANAVPISPGAVVGGVDIRVQPRNSPTAYNLGSYCKLDSATRSYIWSGNMTVTPAFISSSQNQPGLIILQPPVSMPLPQSATILGGIGGSSGINGASTPPAFFNFLAGQPQAVFVYFMSTLGAGTGPRHLVLNFGNDIYVLPGAVNLVSKGPPLLASATPNADGTVTVTGAGLGPESSIYFDGLKANAVGQFSGTDTQGSLTVTPPPGSSGQVATLTVYNTDGQNSMILLGLSDQVPGQPATGQPATYTYPVTALPQITTMSVASLPSSSSAAVDITTTNTNLVDGQVTVGFGSDDITVRRVWVLSPTRLIANVTAAPNAAAGLTEVSIISGFQVITKTDGFQTQAARPGFPFLVLPVVNADASQQTIYPGSVASVSGSNLASPGAQLTLNDVPLTLQSVSPTQINFSIPAGFPVGPATLRLNNGATSAFPVMVQIDSQPPTIVTVNNQSNVPISGASSTTFATAGDVLNAVVTGLDAAVATNPNRLQVTVSGVAMPVLSISPAGTGQFQIQFILTQSFGSNQVPVMVWVDGSSSQPVPITVR